MGAVWKVELLVTWAVWLPGVLDQRRAWLRPQKGQTVGLWAGATGHQAAPVGRRPVLGSLAPWQVVTALRCLQVHRGQGCSCWLCRVVAEGCFVLPLFCASPFLYMWNRKL